MAHKRQAAILRGLTEEQLVECRRDALAMNATSANRVYEYRVAIAAEFKARDRAADWAAF